MITGIVVALPEELATLTAKKLPKGGCLFISDQVVLAYSGAGAANASLAAASLMALGARQLISWGCAGALSADLKPGDLVLADQLLDADLVDVPVDSHWHRRAKNHLAAVVTVHTGCLAESKGIIPLSEDKNVLQSRTGAIAVDMESVAIAKFARQQAVPFLLIRTIVDPLSMDLPLAISYALNAEGEIELGKLLMFLARHPFELPALISLGLNFNAAKKKLKLIAQQLDEIVHCNDDKII
ncbi:MAG: phosphorylase [Methylococcales bacterium]|nr:phosphorylase [Methylococcales bacterium]